MGRPEHRVRVDLWGEHDIASADLVAAALAEALDDSTGDVLVDLVQVEFMGASTVGALVHGRILAAERSRQLTVRVSPRGSAHRLLVLCGLDDMIEPADGAEHQAWRGAETALGSWVDVPPGEPEHSTDSRGCSPGTGVDEAADRRSRPPSSRGHAADDEDHASGSVRRDL